MNRTRLNLLLAVIVLALGAGAWQAKQHKDKPKQTLTPLAAEGVSKIVMEWPGSPTITLEKQGGDWQLTTPVKARADHFEVVGATSLASIEVQSTLDADGIDLKELGFEPPDHVITLNNVRIEFGGSDALQSRRYVRVDGVIKLIDDPTSAALDKDYADLVSKDLFAASDELVRIELPSATLSKGADGQWSAPANTANATPASVKAVAEGWKTARAMWCEPTEGAAPIGPPLRFTLRDGRVIDYVVAATDPQLALYAPALNVRCQLSKALVDELLTVPAPKPPEPAASAPSPAAAEAVKPTQKL